MITHIKSKLLCNIEIVKEQTDSSLSLGVSRLSEGSDAPRIPGAIYYCGALSIAMLRSIAVTAHGLNTELGIAQCGNNATLSTPINNE